MNKYCRRIILHIDMNSYFATVEQQANPALRGKPVGVKGSLAKRTIIAAASIEAKKFGVKTGMRVHEALEICPDLVVVVGEPRKYADVTRRFVEIFSRYTDLVEIFSIDEAFLDVTKTAKLFEAKIHKTKKKNVIPRNEESQSVQNESFSRGDPSCVGMTEESILNTQYLIPDTFSGAIEIARSIKQDIRNEIGSWISCSVGVAENKFLAKLGSDLEKPDGLVVITDDNKDEILLGCDLMDFCGIAHRLKNRLCNMGIQTVADLRKADDYKLKKEFGIYGLKMKRMAWGRDSSEVLDWNEQADAKSFGHSRTLNKDVTKRAEIEKQLYLLSEKVGKRMRDEGFFGKEVGIWLRFKDFSGAGKRHRVGYWVNDGNDIFKYAKNILEELYSSTVDSSTVAQEDCCSGIASWNEQYSKSKKRSNNYYSSVAERNREVWIDDQEEFSIKSNNKARLPVRAIGVYVTNISKSVPQSLFESDQKKKKVMETMDQINNRFGDDVLVRGSLVDIKLKRIVSGLGRKKW